MGIRLRMFSSSRLKLLVLLLEGLHSCACANRDWNYNFNPEHRSKPMETLSGPTLQKPLYHLDGINFYPHRNQMMVDEFKNDNPFAGNFVRLTSMEDSPLPVNHKEGKPTLRGPRPLDLEGGTRRKIQIQHSMVKRDVPIDLDHPSTVETDASLENETNTVSLVSMTSEVKINSDTSSTIPEDVFSTSNLINSPTEDTTTSLDTAGISDVLISLNATENSSGSENDTIIDEDEGEVSRKSPEKRIWEYGFLNRKEALYMLHILQIIAMVVGFISIAAVIVGVVVFHDKRMKSRVTLLVTAFNVTEGCKAAAFNAHRIWRTALGNSMITWSSAYCYFFTNFTLWIPDALGRISLLLNLIITVDRFVALAFPLKSFNRRLVVYPKLAILLVTLSMLLFQTTNVFLFQSMTDTLNMTRQFLPSEIVAEIAMASPKTMNMYRITSMAAGICFRYIPLIVTITLSVMTIVFLVYHNRFQQQKKSTDAKSDPEPSTTARKRQNNLMIVGSTLTFSFIVSVKPLLRLISTLHPTLGEGKKDQYLYTVLNEVGLVLDNASALVIFLTYCKISSVFRKVLVSLFTDMSPGRQNNSSFSS